MQRPIPTVIVSGFPGIGKSHAALLYPRMIRDLESSDYHWVIDPQSDRQVTNPEWPRNYIETIAALNKSGMYKTVMVSSHQEIRISMKAAGIRYTNLCPEDTPEMKELLMRRYKDRGSPESFIQNMDEHWSEYVQGMINDRGAITTIQLTPKTLTDWFAWCFYA